MKAKAVERKSYAKVDGRYVPVKGRIVGFEPFDYTPENIAYVIGEIKKNLTPDLLSTKYREKNLTNPLHGHCYHATQALYYLMDTSNLQPMSGIDYEGETHWWLQDGNTIIDVTEEQYTSVGKLPPHNSGRKSKWYGWKQRPHMRTLNLITRIMKPNYTDLRVSYPQENHHG